MNLNSTGGSGATIDGDGTLNLRPTGVVLADDGELNLPDAIDAEVMLLVQGDNEYLLARVESDGTITSLITNGSVAVTDLDANLCLYTSGSMTIVKNRLGAQKTVLVRITY